MTQAPRRSGASRPVGGASPPGLGSAIRALRSAAGLTLVQVAGRAGLTHSFLSQVERGRAQPSMRSLFTIARALGTTQDRLLAAAAGPATAPVVAVQRADEGVVLGPTDSTVTPSRSHGARSLLGEAGGFSPIEFTGISRNPGDFWYQHDGTEFAYVATGVIVVEFADGTEHRLGPGDSMRYPGHLAHRWRAHGRAARGVLSATPGVADESSVP